MTSTFQVDLRGMVDLLARHLYSGPRVYVRELLQNAVDAVVARQEEEAGAPARVRFAVVDEQGLPVLEVTDTGIGLTAAEAAELLATIGRSSKRDADLGLGRREYIGQFGIGMLAAFMVAQEIEVISRSARADALAAHWRGRDDGTFELAELDRDATAALPIGTTVRLRARRDAEHWLGLETVTALATEFGELLPLDVAVEVQVAGEVLPRRVTRDELPWRMQHTSAGERDRALSRYCEQVFGFTPLGHIDLDVPLTGVSGVAFILPAAVSPGSGRHRVYVKRMLLGERVDGLLPDWAFFVRAVVNADGLNPTASREQLHTDEVLLATQEALARVLRVWATATLTTPSDLAARVITTHHLALRAVALTDADMLDLAAQVLPFETTEGYATLTEVRERTREVLYAATTDAFRRIATVARAQGLVVVNAGYVYDADLLARLGQRRDWQVREVGADDLTAVLTPLEPLRELEVLDAVARARVVLQAEDCDVQVRRFEPERTPALLLRDRDGEHQRTLTHQRESADAVWGGVLDAFAETERTSRHLVLNDDSPLVRQLLAAGSGAVFEAGVRSLYLSAVMLAGDGLRGREVDRLNEALGVLLAAGLQPGQRNEGSES